MVAEITGAKILVAAADLLEIKLIMTKSGISLQTYDQATIGSLVCGPDASSGPLVDYHGREILAASGSFPTSLHPSTPPKRVETKSEQEGTSPACRRRNRYLSTTCTGHRTVTCRC